MGVNFEKQHCRFKEFTRFENKEYSPKVRQLELHVRAQQCIFC